MMITLTCLSPLIGAVLGQRHTFLILIPAIACALTIAAGFGIAAELNFWSTMLAMVLTVTGLEIGYVAGAAVRVAVARRVDVTIGVNSQKPIAPSSAEEPRDDRMLSLNGQADRIEVAEHEREVDQAR
jgi:hypothetical protein